MELYAEVRRSVYVEGLSERAAARRFGLARETVRKMLRDRLPPGYRRAKPIRCPKLDAFTRVIDQILTDDQQRPKKQRHTAKRIWERLRAEHAFTGGYTIVKDDVRRRKLGGQEMFVPLVHPPGDAQADLQRDHEEDQVPPEPGQREHLDGEQIAGREALPVRLQECLPGYAPAPFGSRVDPVVVQDPLHRGPSDLVAEVRERPADPCVPPLWILDRHPDHERGHFASRHRPASTAAGAAVVCLGDQSPVPAENRVKRDDAGDLHQDSPAEFLAAHGKSAALGVGQAKRSRAQVLSEDPILLPEIRDQIVLVAVHPASEREDEELQRRRHGLRLLGSLDQHRTDLG